MRKPQNPRGGLLHARSACKLRYGEVAGADELVELICIHTCERARAAARTPALRARDYAGRTPIFVKKRGKLAGWAGDKPDKVLRIV